MKNKIIFIVTTFFIGIVNIKAATLDLTGTTSVYSGNTVKVTLNVNDASEFYGLVAPVTYDSSKLSYVGVSWANGFSATLGTSIVIDSAAAKSGNFSVAVLTFKMKDTFKPGETTKISVGTADVVDNAGNSAVGDVHTLLMQVNKSSNNYLNSLSVTGHKINFSKTKLNYSINVNYDVESIKINAGIEDAKARLSGVGTKKLELYNNNFYVVVTAENGSKRTYTITVNRKDKDGNVKKLSADNSLKELVIDGYNINFNDEILEYTILLKDDDKKLNISAVSNDKNATIEIKEPENYLKGNNIVTVTVTSENGEVKEFKINAVITTDVVIPPKEKVEESSNVGFYIVIIILSTIVIAVPVIFLILYKKGIIAIKKSNKKVNKVKVSQK